MWGVAIGTGADVAAEASDLTLVGDDLRLAVDALSLARRTLGNHPGQPVLGLRLQHRRHPAGGRRAVAPRDRRRSHGAILALRARELAAPQPLRSLARVNPDDLSPTVGQIPLDGPYYDLLHPGLELPRQPGVTLDSGLCAVYQALVGERLPLGAEPADLRGGDRLPGAIGEPQPRHGAVGRPTPPP